MDGKAMIVVMSRRIAVALYNESSRYGQNGTVMTTRKVR